MMVSRPTKKEGNKSREALAGSGSSSLFSNIRLPMRRSTLRLQKTRDNNSNSNVWIFPPSSMKQQHPPLPLPEKVMIPDLPSSPGGKEAQATTPPPPPVRKNEGTQRHSSSLSLSSPPLLSLSRSAMKKQENVEDEFTFETSYNDNVKFPSSKAFTMTRGISNNNIPPGIGDISRPRSVSLCDDSSNSNLLRGFGSSGSSSGLKKRQGGTMMIDSIMLPSDNTTIDNNQESSFKTCFSFDCLVAAAEKEAPPPLSKAVHPVTAEKCCQDEEDEEEDVEIVRSLSLSLQERKRKLRRRRKLQPRQQKQPRRLDFGSSNNVTAGDYLSSPSPPLLVPTFDFNTNSEGSRKAFTTPPRKECSMLASSSSTHTIASAKTSSSNHPFAKNCSSDAKKAIKRSFSNYFSLGGEDVTPKTIKPRAIRPPPPAPYKRRRSMSMPSNPSTVLQHLPSPQWLIQRLKSPDDNTVVLEGETTTSITEYRTTAVPMKTQAVESPNLQKALMPPPPLLFPGGEEEEDASFIRSTKLNKRSRRIDSFDDINEQKQGSCVLTSSFTTQTASSQESITQTNGNHHSRQVSLLSTEGSAFNPSTSASSTSSLAMPPL